MITNERQLAITRTQATRFEKALQELDQQQNGSSSLPPFLLKAQRDALASQLATLQTEIAEYQSLRQGSQSVFNTSSLSELPQALIKARIARGMTQKDLAERLGLKEQQIQRYEGTRYASVSLKRIQQITDALKVQISERVTLIDTL